ncbi:MAG TPA: HAD family hydrolase [Phycisphaerae bacterium]|nr:HAD family hydrolase [Phycisphaerae bacterium]
MHHPAIFLDRDNTLIANAGYLGDPAGVVLLPGTAAAVAGLRALGFRIVVVSNQAGVARGLYDEAAVHAVNHEMCRQLLAGHPGARIDGSYFCPFHPDGVVEKYRAAHPWRKPGPGMLLQAAADLSLDLAGSWMIGDQYRDVGAGSAAGCRTILLQNPDLPPANEPADPNAAAPDFKVRLLADCIEIIRSRR